MNVEFWKIKYPVKERFFSFQEDTNLRKEIKKILTKNKSRADYMRERRKKTKNFSVEVDKEKFNKLENKLSEIKITKKQWLNQKIDEELKK